MAFHVVCPITCRRICDCDLGFGNGLRGLNAREKFLGEIERLEEFLKDPWSLRIGGEGEGEEMTEQVRVPRVVRRKEEDGEERERRAALQRQAAAASVAAEDYARRLEIGAEDLDLMGETPHPHARDDQGSSNVKVICRICFSGENEGSTRALKMLSCKTCNKKYHRSCIISWAEHRDLFHWSSWACSSCRICEVCRSAGDPSKLMFCRRCDGAYHCYCQQPPHKNVGHGPYCCPKHTTCHSCGSTVPGNGPSTRWFLGYTCCDACGRLFVKGNYCPVCLKVYRDSEMTPMVCCDICERWIHCACDGISDEKYQQFQADQNLQYTCAACRGDCYQVKDTDDAVRELWKRKDETDHKLISSLRASAGLPSQEDTSPNSDNELSSPVIKNDYERTLKFSAKGSSDKFLTNSKECGHTVSRDGLPNKTPMKKNLKFVGNAEGYYSKYEKQSEERSPIGMFRTDGSESKQIEKNKYGSVKESCNNVDRGKSEGLHYKGSTAKTECKNETVKGTKLVIHLGSKNRNVSSSPRSETSSCHKEQDLAVSYSNEDASHPTKDTENHMHEAQHGYVRWNGKGAKPDDTSLRRSSKHGEKGHKVIKLGKISDTRSENNGTMSSAIEVKAVEVRSESDDDIVLLKKKQPTSSTVIFQNDIGHHTSRLKVVSSFASKDTRPLLKLKFKNPYFEQKSSWASQGEEENPVKGQRSKRKRPSTLEKIDAGDTREEEDSPAIHHPKNPLTDQAMDANWILQKLGKDAIGKRVEVHESLDDSWRKGAVADFTIRGGGTSSLLVHLDDGRSTNLDLEKQAVRFASQKTYKRAKTPL